MRETMQTAGDMPAYSSSVNQVSKRSLSRPVHPLAPLMASLRLDREVAIGRRSSAFSEIGSPVPRQ